MIESGYYAPGTEFDPNAPWNEPPSLEEQYGDKAREEIENEMEVDNETYMAWLADSEIYSIDPANVTESTFKKLIETLSDDEMVRDAYYEFSKDKVLERLQEEYSYEPDEDMRDYYLDR